MSLGSALFHRILSESRKKFAYLSQGTIRPDSQRLLGEVTRTYDRIWADPGKAAKRERWARIKGVPAYGGPVSGPDLTILATAADAAESRDVELLTLDHDFIPFADEIEADLGVRIRSGWEL